MPCKQRGKIYSFSKKILLGEKQEGDKIKLFWYEIRFLDSAKFMAATLGSLVKNLTDDDFLETRAAFKDKTELMKRKGVFPFEWLDSVKKLKTESLPPKGAFFLQISWRRNFR